MGKIQLGVKRMGRKEEDWRKEGERTENREQRIGRKD
jgi:hypothetical protein